MTVSEFSNTEERHQVGAAAEYIEARKGSTNYEDPDREHACPGQHRLQAHCHVCVEISNVSPAEDKAETVCRNPVGRIASLGASI